MESVQTPPENTPESEEELRKKKRKRENRVLIMIILILLLLLFILGWQWYHERQMVVRQVNIVQVETGKSDSLTQDLINLQGQYAMLKTNNKEVQAALESKKDSINLLMQEAQKYKNDPYIIAQLKKETATLRAIMQSFVRTIDSLNTLNVQLKQEKNIAVDSLKAEKKTSEMLKKEKGELQTKITAGSMLDATSITAQGVFYRFGKKEVTTEKAKKVQKLKVQFTLTANRIAPSGNKTIYLRVIAPDASEIAKTSDESSMFSFEGTKGFYAGTLTIDYANQEMGISMYGESYKGFIAGKYIIKLYCDGTEVGESTLTLK